jgi:hypothetical protein
VRKKLKCRYRPIQAYLIIQGSQQPGVQQYYKGRAKDNNNTTYTTDRKINAPTDYRLRLGLAAACHRWGMTASYACGITNYESNMIGDASYNVESRLFRLGMSYMILQII